MELRLIIVGFGNIGKAVVKTIAERSKQLKKISFDLKVVAICEAKGCAIDDEGIDLAKFMKKPIWGRKKTIDTIKELNADIMVELTPGNIKTGEPGLSHILTALRSGKDVVTSNKSPLAVAYDPVFKTAKDHDRHVRFEATVGGAIPIIRTLEDELFANKVINLYGILNGTTNFILSKMEEEGIDFDSALKEAQEMGFAETDPTYDIDGIDTASKLVILSNKIKEKTSIADIKVSGIRGVTSDVIDLAKDYGYAIRLVADMENKEVSPRLVPLDHPLNVKNNLNAVLIDTDLAKDLTLIGHGAGPVQTSSAILGDIIKVGKERKDQDV